MFVYNVANSSNYHSLIVDNLVTEKFYKCLNSHVFWPSVPFYLLIATPSFSFIKFLMCFMFIFLLGHLSFQNLLNSEVCFLWCVSVHFQLQMVQVFTSSWYLLFSYSLISSWVKVLKYITVKLNNLFPWVLVLSFQRNHSLS